MNPAKPALNPTPEELAEWCSPKSTSFQWWGEALAQVENDADAAPQNPRRLLGVWSHPDDEAYLSAGLMARTVLAGGQVTLLTVTDGEAGFAADDPRPASERAAQRREELRAAMAVIGVRDIRFLGLPDGGLDVVSSDSVVDQIADVVRDVRPDVIVTFGPDGITGHPDHVATCEHTTRAWAEAEIGELWYAAKTNEWLDEWRELHDRFGVWMTSEPTGVRDDEVEMIVNLAGAELNTKRAVLAEHRSQTEALAAAFGENEYRRWIYQETFRRPSAAEISRYTSLAGLAGVAA